MPKIQIVHVEEGEFYIFNNDKYIGALGNSQVRQIYQFLSVFSEHKLLEFEPWT